MRVTDIRDNDLKGVIKITDLENFFNVYVDLKNNFFYNLNSTVYMNVGGQLSQYILKTDMFWPLISYKLYGTTRLAWLLLKVNKISADDIFKMRRASEIILYPSKEQVERIVSNINGF